MRRMHFIGAGLIGALAVLPAGAAAQVSVSISLGAQLGPPVPVFAYSAERFGPWREDYRHWTPRVLYEMGGRFYRHRDRGARPVEVYLYNGDYFLPPRDAGWVGYDRRYDYDDQPRDDDFGRVRAYREPEAGEAPLSVGLYAADRDGQWRTGFMLWTPVTVYEIQGAYYPRPVRGARVVEIYRYRDRYFLPPDDRDWIGADRRYDYGRRPGREHDDHEDRGRGRGRGHGDGGDDG